MGIACAVLIQSVVWECNLETTTVSNVLAYNDTHAHKHSRKYWIARVPDQYCYNDGILSPQGCTFYFSFCQPLPANANLGHSCAGSAVCQTFVENSPYKKISYSMGEFKTFTRFFFSKSVLYLLSW